ncbi:MAG TPA: hypothetical protein VGO54_13790, partial [Bradyrhizobium sp.]|nr:hypothetical protein [Bradyrhizobium sp.]
MGDKRAIMTAVLSRRIAISATVALAIGCGMLASPASSQSLSDRFKSLFGGKTEAPAEDAQTVPPEGENDL